MTAQLLQSSKPLLPAGESFQMLTHTFTVKVSGGDTHGNWVMYEVADTIDNGAPLHSHPWGESFYILEGELEMQVGNRKLVATAGDSIYIPENVAHNFRICSPSLRALIVMAPASAEGFYRAMGEKITTLPPDPEVFQEICSEYGVRIFM